MRLGWINNAGNNEPLNQRMGRKALRATRINVEEKPDIQKPLQPCHGGKLRNDWMDPPTNQCSSMKSKNARQCFSEDSDAAHKALNFTCRSPNRND